MELKVNGKTYDRFNDVSVTLNYDSVASAFSFAAYFNPDNTDHRTLFKPCSYRSEVITRVGLTGMVVWAKAAVGNRAATNNFLDMRDP